MGKQLDPGHYGKYHADNGDAYALVAGSGDGAEESTDTIAVLSDGTHGSGLDAGWNKREAKRGDKTGEWSPA